MAEEGRVSAALEARPVLLPPLDDVREAFWLLVGSMAMNGGGMAAIHLEPPKTTDTVAMAEVFGFDPLYFLRVIQPSIILYRDVVTERLSKAR